MRLEDQQNFRKIQRISKSIQEHMKDIIQLKEDSRIKVEHIMSIKQQDEIQEDLKAFSVAYSNAVPLTSDNFINQLNKKLIVFQSKSQQQKHIAVLQKTK